jgi:enoyl-CoA hydratase/carnithine racemase
MMLDTGNSNIICDLDDRGVATITLSRAQKRNALSLAMWIAIGELFDKLSDESSVRCVILTGAGGHFSAGADISEFSVVRADAKAGQEYDRLNDAATAAIRNCRKPVVAAVSGVAVGGGLGLAMACDLRVGDSSIRMGIPAGRLGLVYSILDSTLLVERLGLTRAKEVLLTGTIFGLTDAVRLGLVDRVAEPEALSGARALAGEIALNAPLSLIGNKAILNAVADGSAPSRQAELNELIAQAFDSRDYREGQAAFAEKRAPRFTGA